MSRESRDLVKRRPETQALATVCERLAALLEVGVGPRDAWLYLAEVGDDVAVALVAERIRAGVRVPAAVAAAGAGEGTGAGAAVRDAAGVGHAAGAEADVGLWPGAGAAARLGGGSTTTRVGRGSAAQRIGRSARDRESRRRQWAALASVWFVAEASGAPIARCLSDMGSSFAAMAAVERDTSVALAGPRATTRLVLCLPLIAMAAGSAIGIDSTRVLFTTAVGWLCLGGGAVLLAVAQLWSARLLRAARYDGGTPGLGLELLAVALSGGCPPDAAEALVEVAVDRFGLAGALGDRWQTEARDTMTLAVRAGAHPATLLRREASRLRQEASRRAAERAASLGVWLMLPLGVCVLPAFLLFAVVPAFLAVLSDTVTLT